MFGIIQENCLFVKKKEPHKKPCRYRSAQTTGCVVDLNFDPIRVFEFITPNGAVYVAWDRDGTDAPRPMDLSLILGSRELAVTPIVTELSVNDSPVEPEVQECGLTAVPLSIIPVFIE